MPVSRLCLCAAVLLVLPARAATREQAQAWVNLTAMGSIKDRALYFVEVQPRFAEDSPHLSQLLLRGAVGYKVSDAVSLYAGFLHLEQPVERAKDRNEERPFLQLAWQLGDLAGGRLSNRTRLEYRSVSAGPKHGVRVRSMLRYVHPLGDARGARPLVWIEPFYAFSRTSGAAAAGFDQLRSFAGLEIPLAGKSTLEAGYMNQAINDPGPRNRMNHIASLTLFYRP